MHSIHGGRMHGQSEEVEEIENVGMARRLKRFTAHMSRALSNHHAALQRGGGIHHDRVATIADDCLQQKRLDGMRRRYHGGLKGVSDELLRDVIKRLIETKFGVKLHFCKQHASHYCTAHNVPTGRCPECVSEAI